MKKSPPVSAPRKGKAASEVARKSRVASASSAPRRRAKKRDTNVAIATELAPAVALSLLEKTELAPGSPPAALEIVSAGAGPSEVEGMVRVQLMFENGVILPVEMSADAGAALSKGLSEELPK